MPETLKERLDQDGDFQAYIEKLPELLTSVHKTTTKFPLIEASASRQILSQQIGQIPQKPRSVGVIKSTFVRNLDKTSQIVTSRTSSIIPFNISHQPPSNEPARDAEEDNLEDINQVINNLFSDNPDDSPPEVNKPLLIENTPTTPITPDHSPFPSPHTNPKPLPNMEPPISTPLDTHQIASSTQEV